MHPCTHTQTNNGSVLIIKFLTSCVDQEGMGVLKYLCLNLTQRISTRQVHSRKLVMGHCSIKTFMECREENVQGVKEHLNLFYRS